MALQTPRQRSGLQRPSFGNLNSSPSNNPTQQLSASTAVNRKASLQALTGQRDPRTPAAGKMDGASDLEVGDKVNVPGDMYGTVKFIGSVRGKSGKFVGVELGREFAARGKNDGDVDGTHYFNTTVPGAGIFLPVHRAEKRSSPSLSLDSFPPTPNTPSYSTANGQRLKSGNTFTPPTPAVPSKFSQSVGPGARPSSPQFKPKRPSLPRPESPLRKAPSLAPTPARTLSQSQRGTRPGLSTTTPSKNNLRASTTTRPSTSHRETAARPYSRTGSRQGNRPDDVGLAASTNGRINSSGTVPAFSQPHRSPSRLGSAGGAESEVVRLRAELAERDKRLNDQAANLADMEASVKELSGLISPDGLQTPGGSDDHTSVQLRQMLREKNEKITMLTSEFDQHRADFRSTLDSLEMASTETERVYEEQKRDLLAQVGELQDRVGELEELNQSKKDFEEVAQQLKSLEDFVQELEEGLEDARRGEAEARGEVEFLRGEVERGRSELKREREKAAAVANGSATPKELEQRDDEIRGLKAIIQSMSTSRPNSDSSAAVAPPGFADQIHRLQATLEESQKEKERLERALEQVRRDTASTNGNQQHQRNESDKTVSGRSRSNTVKATFAEHARRSGIDAELPILPSQTPVNGNRAHASASEGVYCDMCESHDHDTLDCSQFQQKDRGALGAKNGYQDEASVSATSTAGLDEGSSLAIAPLAMKRNGATPVASAAAGKENQPVSPAKASAPAAVGGEQPAAKSEKTGAAEEEKWCALCEKDGHLAYECPDEQY